jgi:UDP-N-acetylglucosamine 2-epimerase (non-hydrolysing)
VNVAIVIGTRPEIIKMAPLCEELGNRGVDYFILHTGQHYNFNMDRVFFDEFKLKEPDVNLGIGSGTHGETTGKMITHIEKVLVERRPDIVLVNGDTNTTMAGALAAVKLHTLVGHVEAGIRNYDRRMPEEYNRIVADHVSDYLFAPSKLTEQNLMEEGISRGTSYLYYGNFTRPLIFLTGNTIVDVVREIMPRIKSSDVISKLGLEEDSYFYVTAHREENVDRKDRLSSILRGLQMVSEHFDLPMVFPIHPRTRKRVEEFGLQGLLDGMGTLKLVEPGGYIDHLALESNAKLVLTDSGGMQEETCTLKVPAVVMRDVTDRPEGLEVGATMLSGLNADAILEASKIMISKRRDWENPYGDGQTSRKIVDLISHSSGTQANQLR